MLERIVELRKELASHPTSRQFYQLGELLRRQGDAAEAAAVLHEGLEHHPRYVAAWVSLGRARVDLQDAVGAVSALDRALALDVSNPVAWRLMGEARLLSGDRPGALDAMEHALALVPGDQVLEAAVDTLRREQVPPAHGDVVRDGEEGFLPGGTVLPGEEAPEGAERQGTEEVGEVLGTDLPPDQRSFVPVFSEVAPLEAPGTLYSQETTPVGEHGDAEGAPLEAPSVVQSISPAGEQLSVPSDDPFGGAELTEATPFPAGESLVSSDDWDVFAPPDQTSALPLAAEGSLVEPAASGNWDITVTVPPPVRGGNGAVTAGEPAAKEEPSEPDDMGAFGIRGALAEPPVFEGVAEGSENGWQGAGGEEARREPLDEAEGAGELLGAAPAGPGEEAFATVDSLDAAGAFEPAPVSETPLGPAAEVGTDEECSEAFAEPHSGQDLRMVVSDQGQEAPGEVEAAPTSAGPQPTLTLARLFIQQHHLDQAVAVLNEMIALEPGNQEARDLRALVVDMMEPLDGPLPLISLRERKIAALQRWAASLTLSRERMTP